MLYIDLMGMTELALLLLEDVYVVCSDTHLDVFAGLEVIADVFADSVSELVGTHVFHQPHQPSLLPVCHPLTVVSSTTNTLLLVFRLCTACL